MGLFVRTIVVFILLSAAAYGAIHWFGFEFGQVDYWERHGWWLLIFITFFPRLTLLFSSIPFGGFFWWIGWLFAPRLLVALLATMTYWQTNPVLVVIAWLVCLGGESSEKYAVHYRATYKTRS